jgi:hypothetical protein
MAITKLNKKMIADFSCYAENCLRVQTQKGGLEPFRLNAVQRLLEDIVADIYAAHRPVRLVILKARRQGISTWAAGRFYWKTVTGKNRNAMLITHEPEATEFLFNVTKRFYRNAPKGLRPAVLYNNRRAIEFNDLKRGGLDSAIRVATAGKEDLGSGQLIHFLHLSEVAKWPSSKAPKLLSAILQCVPDDASSEIIFESTAKGIGGEFYDRFLSSRFHYEMFLDSCRPAFRLRINEAAGRYNVYSSVFIPWFVFEDYTIEAGGISREALDEKSEDEELVRLYNLDAGRLAWRRWALENRCRGLVEVFKQEYPSNAHEAFISENRSLFDTQAVLALQASAPAPSARFECELASGADSPQWNERADGELRVWESALPKTNYIVGADVAEGIEGGDFSCADVVEHLSGRQVAQWHGRIDPDRFGITLAALGYRYNDALVAVERNNHGLTTVTALVNAGYPNLYVERADTLPAKSRRRFGWVTSSKTKPQIIDNLVSELRDGTHGIVCAETFGEMLTYVRRHDGSVGARPGAFDDRVMSLAIAKYARMEIGPVVGRSRMAERPSRIDAV